VRAPGGGGGVELVLFPGATHSFRPAEQFHATLFATTARWIDSHFPLAPPP
jgi:dipeptidyl aminopeptidase/acylaminoacyl peptidase